LAREPVIYRDEGLTIMWLIGDMSKALERLVQLVEDEDGEEEEPEED